MATFFAERFRRRAFSRGNAFDVSVEITGAADVISRLSKLPDKLQKKGAVRASRAAMRIAVNAAKANSRKLDDKQSPERIWRNIAPQNATRKGRQVGGVVIRVGVRGGAQKYANTKENRRKGRVGKKYKTGGDKSNPGGDTWYWRFLEFGTAKMAAQPFLLPALANNAAAIEAKLATELDREIGLAAATK